MVMLTVYPMVFFECSNIEDDEQEGRRTFRKRDRFGNGQLLLIGDHLLIHTEHGKLKIVEATPDSYVELGEIPTITGICWNTICLYDKYLLVRSEREAACFELSLNYDSDSPDSDATDSDNVEQDDENDVTEDAGDEQQQ